MVVGIADGVGGWEDSGVDPSHFSQALMYYCREEVRKSVAGANKAPREILAVGFEGVTAEKEVVAGECCGRIVLLWTDRLALRS